MLLGLWGRAAEASEPPKSQRGRKMLQLRRQHRAVDWQSRQLTAFSPCRLAAMQGLVSVSPNQP